MSENEGNIEAAKLPQKSKSSKRCFPLTGSSWTPEIIAAFISVSAILVLLGVLVAFDGHVVQEIALGITLSGLVATLATISRTAVMIPVSSCLSQSKWLRFSINEAELQGGTNLEDLETIDDVSRGPWGSFELLWKLQFR